MAHLFPPETVAKLAQLATPASTGDVVALAAAGFALAAYLSRGTAWDKPDPYRHLWFERPQLKSGGRCSAAEATRNIAQKLIESNKDLVIFWGSQSGTAEAFANRLARECHLHFGLDALSADLGDYDADTIALIPGAKLAIFIVSTFGEGDPSDNATGFLEWLLHNGSNIRLPNLQYLAFGLGNSEYKYYNRVVDTVVEALDKAGAQRLAPAGKADDANGATEEDFLAWKDKLFNLFQEKLGYEERHLPYSPGIAVVEDESLSWIDLNHGEPIKQRIGAAKAIHAYSQIRPLTVTSAHELTSSSARCCLHMELDLSDHAELRYKTGDHLAIYPINPDQEVQLLLQVTGLEGREQVPLLLNPLAQGTRLKLPSPTTALALFRHYMEICSPVSRDTVRDLAQFAPSRAGGEILLGLGRSREAYAAFVAQNHVTVARLLALAAPGEVWNDLPLSYLLEVIPPIQPRYYSISSSSTVSPRRPTITVGVENRTLSDADSTEIRGLTTNYLLALADSFNGNTGSRSLATKYPTYALAGPSAVLEGYKVFACLRQSKFRLPALSSTPLIMIGAGTGIAPFRAFVLERARLKAVGKPVGRMLLFFGCRQPDEDFLYRAELAEATAALGGCLEVVTAFSRAEGAPKTYVQDRVSEREDEVCRLLSEGGNLYVCGRAAMAREVGRVVEESMARRNGWDDSGVRSWSRLAKKSNKWLEDVWG